MFTIDFEPIGRRGKCSEDHSILKCARDLNVDIVSLCGGMGVCNRCKVQIISGAVAQPMNGELDGFTEQERISNYRLACRTYPLGKVKVHVPPESLTAPQRTQPVPTSAYAQTFSADSR